MDVKSKLLEIQRLRAEQDELKRQASILHREEMQVRREVSNFLGEKYSGFKIGDVIQWTDRRRIIKMVITHFEAYTYDVEIEDTHPTIHGIVILKNGEIGTRTDSVYSHSKLNPQKCGEMKLPTA